MNVQLNVFSGHTGVHHFQDSSTPLTRLGSRKGIESWSQSTELDCESFWAGCIICVESKRPLPPLAPPSFPWIEAEPPSSSPPSFPLQRSWLLASCASAGAGTCRLQEGKFKAGARNSILSLSHNLHGESIWDSAIERSRQLSVAICWWHNPLQRNASLFPLAMLV